MPNEPRPTIHEVLAAYANHRRRQAGPPFVLPPEARRALREEVDRHFAGRSMDAAAPAASAWNFRLRWAWAGIAVAAVSVICSSWLLVNRQRDATTKLAQLDAETRLSRRSATSVNAAGRGVPDSGVPTAPGLPLPPPSMEILSSPQPSSAVAAKARRDGDPAIPDPNQPRIRPGAARAQQDRLPAPPAAPDTGAMPNRDRATASASASRVRFAAESPAMPTDDLRQRSALAPRPQSQFFTQVDAGRESRGSSGSPSAPPVLDRFRMESAGDRLRIIDADGSIYEGIAHFSGTSVARDKVVSRPVAPVRSPVDAGGATPGKQGLALARPGPDALEARTAVVVAAPRAEVHAAELSFEAQGTNNTVNQLVRIEGRLIFTNQAVALLPPGLSTAVAGPQSLAFWISNSVVRGQATIGGRNQIEVNARPTAP